MNHMGKNRRRRAEGGAVAIEFALVMPMFLLLVFGMIQYGVYFWSAQGSSNATREAARRAAVGDYPTCAAFRADVRTRIDSLGDAATAEIWRTYSNGPGNVKPTVEVGDVVTVTVEFQTPDLHLPLVPFLDNGIVRQSADARVENVPTDAVEACPE